MNDFKNYLEYSEQEHKEKQLKIMDKITISEDTADQIKKINKKLEFLIFAEPYCPDCRSFVPFMEKFAEINPNIKVDYLSRTNNMELLSSLSKEARIPSMFYHIKDKYYIAYLELPKFVWDRINKGEDSNELRYNYRTGVYNKELEKELLEIVLKAEKDND